MQRHHLSGHQKKVKVTNGHYPPMNPKPQNLRHARPRPIWYPFPCGERPMTPLQYILGWRPRPRNGKIARLPQAMREHINQMIEDGVPYHAIIDRLKDSDTPPPIAISEMNLS